MTRSRKRLVTFIGALLATAGVIVASCFAVNCLVDPLWYLRGNVLTEINYPFNERLSKLIRFLPRMNDYDCMIFGTSRATLLPEEQAKGYRCFNMAVSDGQASEHLLFADYHPRAAAVFAWIVVVSVTVPTVERGFFDVVFCSIEIAGAAVDRCQLSLARCARFLDPHVAGGCAAPPVL
jgi:hypothetical protein